MKDQLGSSLRNVSTRVGAVTGEIKPSLGARQDYYNDPDIVDGYEDDRRGTRGGRYIEQQEDDWTRAFLERHGYDWNDLSDARILDVGGGPGNVTRLLAKKGADVDYLDLSPAMAQTAKQRGEETYAANNYLVGDATTMPLPDNTYDLAISRRAAHVIPEEAFPSYLAELGRVATDGALFDTFRSPSTRQLYNWALPMPSVLRTDATVRTIIEELDHVTLEQVDHDFVIPYGAFRRTDHPDLVEQGKEWNESLTNHFPGMASVSIWDLSPKK